MINTAEYIIFARHCQDTCGATSCSVAAGSPAKSVSCAQPKETIPTRNGRPMMKLWGMLSEEDEQAGFRLYVDDDWYVLLLCNGKTMALFDPYDYTMPELQEKVKQVLRVIRRNPFLVCAGRIHLSEN